MEPNNDNNNNDLNENENIDEYYDYLPADHPLLKKLQSALEDQLKKEEENLRLLHKEKSEELKKIKRTREDIGINLYSNQQQYAKLEETFNAKYSKYITLKEQREKTEKRLIDETKNYNDKFSGVREQQKMVLQATEELNQLNSMLKYVETYNKTVKSEIKVTDTNAHVVEKKIKENEREKRRQDFFIDYLQDQIKNLTEKKNIIRSAITITKRRN